MDPWLDPPPQVRVSSDEVHVWRLGLQVETDNRLKALLGLLSDDERARAARFHFDRDRNRFIAGRGQLREILGRYLDKPPDAVRFRYGLQGKPFLEHHRRGFQFNLAHSGDLALVAVTTNRQVGVDIEKIHPVITEEEIAQRFFSAEEIVALRVLPGSEQRLAFFLCWTRKEAFLKALGEGIAYGLDQFTVTLTPGEPALLLEVLPDPSAPTRWSLADLQPGDGYAGAVAFEGHDERLLCWQYPAG
jgi:4'-phosphopantetheinyl transferase